MTPSTLMFLYLLSCAVCWGAKWMREWEERDHARIVLDRGYSAVCFDLMREKLGEILREELDLAFMMGEDLPDQRPPKGILNSLNRDSDPVDSIKQRNRKDGR